MALEHDSDSALALAVRKAGSQTAFAELIGTRQSTVHGWLAANRPLPSEYLRTVSEKLDIPIEDLLPPPEEYSPSAAALTAAAPAASTHHAAGASSSAPAAPSGARRGDALKGVRS